MKHCTKCGVLKNLSQYYLNSSCIGGHLGICKLCYKEAYKVVKSTAILPLVNKIRLHDRNFGTDLMRLVNKHTRNPKVRTYET